MASFDNEEQIIQEFLFTISWIHVRMLHVLLYRFVSYNHL